MVQSKISWTGSTWNPWHGCKKVSPGCKYCYMYRDKDRYGQDPTKVLKGRTTFNKPLEWASPKLIFTCSWSDWFIDEADEWRPEAWDIIYKTPYHQYQILTKRPERIATNLPPNWRRGYGNVWLGVSAEDQTNYDKRVPILMNNDAQIRFLSLEPLLGPIDLSSQDIAQKCSWIILGGESGNETGNYRYRPSSEQWYRDIITQATKLGIPVWVKQLGTHWANNAGLSAVDKHATDSNFWPQDLQVRNFPIHIPQIMLK